MVESLGICDELAAQGKFLDASPLQSVTTAATVRVRDGQTLVTDGPFAETTEQLGGYYVLDLADLDEAIAVAARLPPAAKGTVEIRPLFALDGLPPDRPLPAAAARVAHPVPAALLRRRGGVARRPGPRRSPTAMAEAAALARRARATRAGTSAPRRSTRRRRPRASACATAGASITDGPFAETHEVLGGYYLILAESRDAAVRIAARHPGARVGAVEVRPLFDLSGLRKPS